MARLRPTSTPPSQKADESDPDLTYDGHMQVTLKLYAQLGQYLPPHALRNEVPVEIPDGTSIWDLVDAYNVPRTMCHLVLVNGVFKAPALRDAVKLQPGDALAIWPPVAGG